jgi:hypothetical protein
MLASIAANPPPFLDQQALIQRGKSITVGASAMHCYY